MRKLIKEQLDQQRIDKFKELMQTIINKPFKASDENLDPLDKTAVWYKIDHLECFFWNNDKGEISKSFRMEVKVTILPQTIVSQLNDDDESLDLFIELPIKDYLAGGGELAPDGYVKQHIRRHAHKQIQSLGRYLNMSPFKVKLEYTIGEQPINEQLEDNAKLGHLFTLLLQQLLKLEFELMQETIGDEYEDDEDMWNEDHPGYEHETGVSTPAAAEIYKSHGSVHVNLYIPPYWEEGNVRMDREAYTDSMNTFYDTAADKALTFINRHFKMLKVEQVDFYVHDDNNFLQPDGFYMKANGETEGYMDNFINDYFS